MATSKPITAKAFLKALQALPGSGNNARFFKGDDPQNKTLNTKMSDIFALAKANTDMPLTEVEVLLESPYYEARMGAVSIMDFQARSKQCSAARHKDLFDLYIRRHDRINNWDLVDRSAPYVVGGYLFDKAKSPLTRLAKSKNPCERRTAIVSTYYFIRQNQTQETFRIAEILVHDKDDLVNKAVGSWIREAGKRDNAALLSFLDNYASTMPRVTLRYAVEKLDAGTRARYLKL